MIKMQKIDVSDVFVDSNKKNTQQKTIKIDDNLCEIGIRKGLIEKSGNSYFFIGDYEDLIAFMNSKRKMQSFDWLD